ncbi:hypothetical protein EVAR_92319_1 [Eumeta japonica]|uniref:Uncharacterized protein n=1 Tax=Eumeta variegata TaxID=151549 RepID=A0A4C1TLJ2_EUMVA|nr:hypothetical protein EVAR_92319_1 [Eumeta japonica]
MEINNAISVYNRQKAKSKYRDRIPFERAFREQFKDTNKTLDHIQGRKRTKAPEQINNGASTPEAGATAAMQLFLAARTIRLASLGWDKSTVVSGDVVSPHTRGTQTCKPSKSRWPQPPVDINNPRRDTSALPASCMAIGYLREEGVTLWRGSGQPELSLNGQNAKAEAVTSRLYRIENETKIKIECEIKIRSKRVTGIGRRGRDQIESNLLRSRRKSESKAGPRSELRMKEIDMKNKTGMNEGIHLMSTRAELVIQELVIYQCLLFLEF